MTMELLVLLLVLDVAGIVLTLRYMRKKPERRTVCIVCIVVMSLIALALLGYIGSVLILLDAIKHQPPA